MPYPQNYIILKSIVNNVIIRLLCYIHTGFKMKKKKKITLTNLMSRLKLAPVNVVPQDVFYSFMYNPKRLFLSLPDVFHVTSK